MNASFQSLCLRDGSLLATPRVSLDQSLFSSPPSPQQKQAVYLQTSDIDLCMPDLIELQPRPTQRRRKGPFLAPRFRNMPAVTDVSWPVHHYLPACHKDNDDESLVFVSKSVATPTTPPMKPAASPVLTVRTMLSDENLPPLIAEERVMKGKRSRTYLE